MVDAWLIVLAVVVVLFTVGTVIYMMVVFSSPDDKNSAYFPKAIIVVSLCLSLFTVLLLPLDVSNTIQPTVWNAVPGGLHLDILWQIILMSNLVFVLLIIPFAICYYEGYDPESIGIGKQLRSGIFWTVGILIFFVAIFLLGWFLGGETQIPYEAYTVESIQWNNDTNRGNPSKVYELSGQNLSVQCSPIIYAIAILAFLGWFFFVVFGGVGIAALPMDLILGFIHRPMAITTQQYAAMKAGFQDISGELMARGLRLMEKHKMGKGGAKMKRAMNEFNFECKEMERKYKRLEVAYKDGGESPFKSFGKLFLGIVGIGISLAWVLHIILNNATHVSPFLNNLFSALDNVMGLLGTIVYAIFTVYLLWATVSGVVKVSNRFMFFEIHPLRPNDTLTNSFLFNCLILQFTAITITQFASSSFDKYTNGSDVNTMFVIYIQNLKGLGVVFKYIQYALLGTIGIGVVFILLCPYKPRKDDN